ncbi:uncharacterized protein B0I36DRAFT_389722 [Microdochium trichocladiopsis]|uniref:Uncharacterized protein n=1 Tax=Microdochium trichocladiopsis TaxID=1682393 RepID=A0A9P8XR41_9PEZI|nr:uncharacterized protein B0I36DRAFT_389722 [Microdochium trichocladiopsis]KAH7012266.1 hypothetical protein B0I36DRAFT_389722 [Microdochium trichocladiopsis]
MTGHVQGRHAAHRSGGLKKLLIDLHAFQLRLKGWGEDVIFVCGPLITDNFSYSIYDELTAYIDGTYSSFDPSLDPRHFITGEQKFKDDRVLAVPLISDLLTTSIGGAMHLLKALEKEGMLSIEEEDNGGIDPATAAKFKEALTWVGMDIARMILGNESFFANGKPPASPAEYLKLLFQQVGGALAVDSTKRYQQSGRTRKEQKSRLQAEHDTGARRLKPRAPVQTMFKRRYAHQAEEQIDLYVLQETVHLGMTSRKLGNDGSGHARKGFMLARIKDEARVWRIRQQAAMACTPQRQAPVIDPADVLGQAST